jgi:hypothetical protein
MASRISLPQVVPTDSFESLKPATFVFGDIDIASGIHGSANGIKELAREEKPGAVADRREDLAGCVIQNIDFPLILVDDIDELLIGVAGKLDRNRRSPLADLLHQSTRREGPPRRVAIFSKVLILRGVVLPWDIDVLLVREQKIISSAGARAMVDACATWAERNHVTVAMSVLDWGGNLVESHAMEGAAANAIDTALLKAKSALRWRRRGSWGNYVGRLGYRQVGDDRRQRLRRAACDVRG